MTEQLQLDFDKIIKTSIISKKGIELKRNYLKKFLEKGFPNRKQENFEGHRIRVQKLEVFRYQSNY